MVLALTAGVTGVLGAILSVPLSLHSETLTFTKVEVGH